MNTKIVRIYGDSLSLPRPEDNVNSGAIYSDIFQKFLTNAYSNNTIYCYNRGYGGATIKHLYNIYKQDGEFSSKKEDALIIQCGIVDCAPRPVPNLIRRIIGILPDFMRRFTIKILNRSRPYLLSLGIYWRYTSEFEFTRIFNMWLNESRHKFKIIIVINIAPTIKSVEVHSPGLSKSIAIYNALINKCVEDMHAENIVLVNFHDAVVRSNKKNILDDGIHISTDGHELCCNLIIKEYLKIQCE